MDDQTEPIDRSSPRLSEREERAYRAIAEQMNSYQRSNALHVRVLRAFGVGYFRALSWRYWIHCKRRRFFYWFRAIPLIAMAWIMSPRPRRNSSSAANADAADAAAIQRPRQRPQLSRCGKMG